MKKIAVVCNYVLRPDRIGGMDRFFKLFDEQLKKKGCEVDWFFTDYEAFDFYEGLNIHSANNSSVEQKFIELSRDKSYDVIITHFTELCTPFYKEYKSIHTKAYIIAVDHNPRPIEGFPIRKRFKKIIKGVLYSKYINQFVAVSNYSKTHLIKDFTKIISNKIKVVLNGIDTKNIKKKTQYGGRNKFMLASHLRKEKGIQDIITAISALPIDLSSQLTITVYGVGIYEEYLKSLVLKLNLEKVFIFKGSVDNLNIKYADYDYLIHASHGETYCYSVVEALTANLPVITTINIGNVLQLVKQGKNGFLFEAEDVEGLGLIIKNILLEEYSITESSFQEANTPLLSLVKMVDDHIELLPCI